jgi:hypothetical protein
VDGNAIGGTHFLPPASWILMLGHVVCEVSLSVRNRMPVSLRGGGGELGNLKT